jgi:hypothetical protein
MPWGLVSCLEIGLAVLIFSSARARGRLRSLAFNRDQCNVPCALDEFDFGVRAYPRLRGVEGKGTEHVAIFRQNRIGPGRANPARLQLLLKAA